MIHLVSSNKRGGGKSALPCIDPPPLRFVSRLWRKRHRGGPVKTIRQRAPFTRFWKRLHNNELRARLVTGMQLGVKRPRERLRIMGDHRNPSESRARGNPRMRYDVRLPGSHAGPAAQPPQVCFVFPSPNLEWGFGGVMLGQLSRAAQDTRSFANTGFQFPR